MLISEIYQSRQGEGLWSGVESIFVRTSGCNLRCWFCDTPYTSWAPAGETLVISQIIDRVRYFSAEHVVITGGEPMIWPELVELTQQLKRLGKVLTIETAGTRCQSLTCDLMSISPKLSNSTPSREQGGDWSGRHESRRWRPQVVRQLMDHYPYQLKFVVDEPHDIAEIIRCLDALSPVDPRRVLLMPQGTNTATLTEKAAWLEPLAARHGFVFCPRLHIHWYGHRRGT